MAHFAELNSSNVVLRVIVISNEDTNAHGGDLSTGVEDFVETIVPFSTGGTSWKQTYYNHTFRKHYAGVGYSYDAGKDVFIVPKPYPSWTLDGNNDWVAPVAYPNDVEEGGKPVDTSWDEDNSRWLGTTFAESGETNYRWDASNKEWIAL